MSVSFSPPFCAEDNQVVILLHKAGLQNTTMYFLEAGKNTSLITVTPNAYLWSLVLFC